MSKQLNFFACGADESFICETIVDVFADGLFVLPDRGEPSAMVPRPVKDSSDLASSKLANIVYLLPAPAINSLKMRKVPEGRLWVNLVESPVIEYSPCRIIAAKTVKIGRFASFYRDDPQLNTQVMRLYRKLKRGARTLPSYRAFWIFSEAAQDADWLVFWGGPPKPNSVKKSA